MKKACEICGKALSATANRYCLACYRKEMGKRNVWQAPARMRAKNPMFRPESRKKMVETLNRIGHKPRVRGGNGKPTPVQQERLAKLLRWPCEVIVPTGTKGCGIPTHYKIDIGNAPLKIGVEVDGYSHCSEKRRAQDRKKEKFLGARGWEIIRFTNEEVESDIKRCLAKVKNAELKKLPS